MASEAGWRRSSLRACLVIDPNFHSPSYGELRFDHLIDLGRSKRFHTSIATVPLDSIYRNRRVIETIRGAPDAISVSVHGNTHDGFPVLLRRRFSTDPGQFALDAFLGLPLIVYAHASDLKGDGEPVMTCIEEINQLGDVAWQPPIDLARGNLWHRSVGDTVIVCPWTRSVVLAPNWPPN